ncbi:MAG: hypothetical protein LEGION0398_MBIBDBAK_00607 [Legionellaceae bacterium]
MSEYEQPFIPANKNLPELTLKVVCLGIILAVLLAVSNTYLALKIGILTSASIPAAVLSMGIFRFFKRGNILENNLVQTAASAGEAVAGGIVYTLPAMVIIHYWFKFDYWQNLAIALSGGILGVLFSIPLRKVLVTDRHLPFPEGKAIAHLLDLSNQKSIGFKEILLGGAAGAGLEFAQAGLQIMASTFQKWFIVGKSYIGFGTGFSASLIGAGYLMGFRIGISLFIGALIGWLIAIPILSMHEGIVIPLSDPIPIVMNFWSNQIRFIGIGAMLTAGTYTLLTLFKPFCASICASTKALASHEFGADNMPRTEQDIPFPYVIAGILLILLALYALLKHVFFYESLGLPDDIEVYFYLGCLAYILIIGFIFCAICGYFSGLVGVTASPGSGIVIAALVIAALLIRSILPTELSSTQLAEASAITIILGSLITSAACIANDNIQDLKVGYIVGSTPWKQQIMLIIGVIASAAVTPPIMQLLFNVYGIADVMPHPGMDPSKTLSAPPAAMMAAITQAVFDHHLPWNMILLGVAIIIFLILLNFPLKKKGINISTLAVALGIYLPLTSSIPLFLGSFLAWMNARYLQGLKTENDSKKHYLLKHKNILLACGLVSGAALTDVILAIPFGITHNPNLFKIILPQQEWLSYTLSFLSIVLLGMWFHKNLSNSKMN